MEVEVSKDAISVQIHYWPDGGGLTSWIVSKTIDASTMQVQSATVLPGLMPRWPCSGETARVFAFELQKAAHLAEALDRRLKRQTDFDHIEVEEWPAVTFPQVRDGHGGWTSIWVPKQDQD